MMSVATASFAFVQQRAENQFAAVTVPDDSMAALRADEDDGSGVCY
jgi:hypothetical protein